MIILLPLFLAFFAFVMWSIFSKAGKGRMLGGSILRSASQEISKSQGIVTTSLRAHVIEAKDGSRHVGLELSKNAKLSASMTPFKLTRYETETLINMLREVASET